MKSVAAALAIGLAVLLTSAACLPLAPAKPAEGPKAAAEAPKPSPDAPKPTVEKARPQVEASKPAASKPPLSLEEIQTRRQIEKELDRDVDAYYTLLKDRNVEKAVEMTPPESRDTLQGQLWGFFANYSIENHDLREKKIEFEKTPLKAEVAVSLTVYETRSVSPRKMAVTSHWRYSGGSWLLLPFDK